MTQSKTQIFAFPIQNPALQLYITLRLLRNRRNQIIEGFRSETRQFRYHNNRIRWSSITLPKCPFLKTFNSNTFSISYTTYHCTFSRLSNILSSNLNLPNIPKLKLASFLILDLCPILLHNPKNRKLSLKIFKASLALWKHHVNLLLQNFRAVSSDLHQC